VLGVELFQVYDRWGELLFETQSRGLNDEQSGWDGTHRGKKVLPGVYIWRADIRLNDGSLLQKKGEVTVTR
jgi:CHU_C Type IX secretion signal domain